MSIMLQIYPLEEQAISRFCGQVVCAITKDRTRHIGVLSRCADGTLYLNEQLQEEVASDKRAGTLQKNQSKKRRNSPSKRLRAQALGAGSTPATANPYGGVYGPYGPGGPGTFGAFGPYRGRYPYNPFGPAIALDLALLAFLFLLL